MRYFVTKYIIMKLNKNNLQHETIIYEMTTFDLIEWGGRTTMRDYSLLLISD